MHFVWVAWGNSGLAQHSDAMEMGVEIRGKRTGGSVVIGKGSYTSDGGKKRICGLMVTEGSRDCAKLFSACPGGRAAESEADVHNQQQST